MARVAAVTGAASGIGLGVAKQFVADGYQVALLDLDGPGVKVAAEELRAAGAAVASAEVDVADRDSVRAAFDQIRSELGPVEILVTSAGIENFTAVLDITDEAWDRLLAVNL
ncbi:MAG: SDR family NAD(P)-dependent oxidoreductase, partial [Frankiaceae bacterium]|nr:SDR family NAD(P)-dependent oxidoreductase [Frankiaceae bacterium]